MSKINVTGRWLDITDNQLGSKWNRNLVVSNAAKVIAAAIGNLSTTKSYMISGLDWTESSKTLTFTGAFSGYYNNWSDTDYVLVRFGTGLSSIGSTVKVVSCTADNLVLESSIGSDVTDNTVSVTIFKEHPRLHNLYLALGTGSSSWDNEMAYPSKSATSLVQEYYRKSVSFVRHIKDYTGGTSAATATTLTSPDFAIVGQDCVGQILEITDGLGVGQVVQIASFDSSLNKITVASWPSTTPDTTSKWSLSAPSLYPTGTLEISTTFEATEANANGTIREMGLFGANATNVIGSGEMLNCIHHTAITKTTLSALTRIIRLNFEVG